MPQKIQMRSPKFNETSTEKARVFLDKAISSLQERFENYDQLGRPHSYFSVSDMSPSDNNLRRSSASPLFTKSRLAEFYLQDSFKVNKNQNEEETIQPVHPKAHWKKKNPKIGGKEDILKAAMAHKKQSKSRELTQSEKNILFIQNKLKKQQNYEISESSKPTQMETQTPKCHEPVPPSNQPSSLRIDENTIERYIRKTKELVSNKNFDANIP